MAAGALWFFLTQRHEDGSYGPDCRGFFHAQRVSPTGDIQDWRDGDAFSKAAG